MQIRMKQSKKTEKATKHHNVIEPTIEMIQMELQNNVSDLRASENFLCETGKALGKHVIRSKRLIEVQRKLFDHLFELQLKRVNGLKNLRSTLSKAKNPKKVLKKLPLRAEELEQFERILSGEEELTNWMTDSRITLFTWNKSKNVAWNSIVNTTTQTTLSWSTSLLTELCTNSL